MTSVDLSGERVGYEDSKLLDRMMAGEAAPSKPIYFPPRLVVTRCSTDIFAIEDPYLVQAIRFIRERACQGIGVEDVVAAVPLSRSILERRFKQVLNRSPKAELLRVQLGQARQFLVETDLSISDIVEKTGFSSLKHFCDIFRKKSTCLPVPTGRKTSLRHDVGKLTIRGPAAGYG